MAIGTLLIMRVSGPRDPNIRSTQIRSAGDLSSLNPDC